MILLKGIQSLWSKTLGDPNICIAILDSPVDKSHPCFEGAHISHLQTLASGGSREGGSGQHGTHVASVIFGQHNSSVRGLAPECRGLIIPVFSDGIDGSLSPCSQLDLARAITQAVENDANIINISGGQLTQTTQAEPLLAKAVQLCAEKNVLIVAAAGNNGCACIHIPAAMPSVLAVGAMDDEGNPVGFSNWGDAYKKQGVLTLGKDILGAMPGGSTILKSGTSFATPIVSGIAALLLSLQRHIGANPDPHLIRDIILNSALPCNFEEHADCSRFLAGTLNVSSAIDLLFEKEQIPILASENMNMENQHRNIAIPLEPVAIQDAQSIPSQKKKAEMKKPINISNIDNLDIHPASKNINEPQESNLITTSDKYETPSSEEEQYMSIEPSNTPLTVTTIETQRKDNQMTQQTESSDISSPINDQVAASEGCNCGGGPVTLVYALGTLGIDFWTEARRDAIQQAMPTGTNPANFGQLLTHFESSPWDASSVIWTLNLDLTPLYAIVPTGPFANTVYERLRAYLSDQNVGRITRVSIPGVIQGSVTLMSGQTIPVVVPEVRQMYGWETADLAKAILKERPKRSDFPEGDDGDRNYNEAIVLYDKRRESFESFLIRLYFDLRNEGDTPEKRALNFAGTNAVQLGDTFERAFETEQTALDTIEVVRSPFCRPDSICFDIKFVFYDPINTNNSRRVYRYTIDVSDVSPVTVDRVKSWLQR